MEARFSFPRAELRNRTVRGVALNAAFLALIDGLVLAQGLIVTRLLGPRSIGLYGIVTVTAMTILALKRVGIDEAFVQQTEEAQEVEFQRAFTLELALSACFSVLLCALAPLLVVVYGDHRLLALTVATAYLPLALAAQAPLWVFFRRMDFARQRGLQAIVPAVTFAVTVPLAATGTGVWSLVIGPAAGNLAGLLAAWAVSPYRLAVRYDPATARRYLRFSLPVFASVGAWMVVQQGQVLAFELDGGLAAAGYITVAATFARYVDRADTAVISTLYPAICAIQGRTRALVELFEKSNRATLAWVMPFAGLAVLFAPDLVHFVLGDRWRPAIVLIQGLGVALALQQIGFNWFSFYRAHGRTGPGAVEAVVAAVAFLALAVPGLALGGPRWFVYGRVAGVLVTLAVRVRYVRALLPGVSLARMAARAGVPVAAGAAAALAVRLAAWGGERSAVQAVAEVLLFMGVYALATMRLERGLIAEVASALRGRVGAAA